MKANLKGQGGAKGLLLLHGEKLGMAVVVVCAAMFVYASLSQQRLPGNYRADNLDSQIRQARQAIQQYQWDQAPNKGEAEPLKDIADIAVDADDYTLSNGWDPPVVPPTVLRTDPVLLSADDVEGHGGSGLLAFIDKAIQKKRQLEREVEAKRLEQARAKDLARQQPDDRDRRRNRGDDTMVGPDGKPSKLRPAGGGFRPEGVPQNGDERVELAYWACVVAEVPVKDQLKLYRDVFENARGSGQADEFPQYLGFFVQRAEVRPGQSLQWQPVAVYDGQGKEISPAMSAKVIEDIVKDWAAETPEVVDPRYIEPALLYPLPPLVGRNWGSEVTHPDIPLASETSDQPVEDDIAADGQPEAGDGKTDASDLFSGQTDSTRNPRYGPGRSGMSRSIRGPMPGWGAGAPYAEGGGPPRNWGAMAGRGGAYPGRTAGGNRTALPRGVTHFLLRFFDFDVQPGRKYKYQVRLVMADPNRGIRRDWLDSSVLERMGKEDKRYRLTDWSKPSATIGIPDAGSVRLVETKPPSDKVYNAEPSIELLVEAYDVDNDGKAMQAETKEEFHRGSVANMTKDAEILVQRNQFIEPRPDFKFHTGITVLDVRGGDRLSRDMDEPASVLLMSPAGQLTVRKQLDDEGDVERYDTIFTKDNTRRGRRSPADERYGPPPGAYPGGYPGMMPGSRF